MPALPVQILAKPAGAGWQPVPWKPIGYTHEHGAPGGPVACEFTAPISTLHRPPELRSGTPIAAMIPGSGIPIWRGQVGEAIPDGIDGWRVTGRGPVKYLAEDLALNKFLVKTGMEGFQSVRDYNVTLGYINAMTIEQANGVATMHAPYGTTIGNGFAAGVTYDAGYGNTVKRFTVTYEGGTHASFGFYAYSEASPGDAAEQVVIDAAPIAAGPTTFSATFTTARRYCSFYLYNLSGGAVTLAAATAWVQITDAILYTDTAYESGNASILKASDIATIVAGATDTDIASTSTALITTSSTNLPEFTTEGYESAYDMLERANAVDGNEWGYTTELVPRLRFGARATGPATYVANQADMRSIGASANLTDWYNQVRVRWRNGAGVETVTTLNPTTDTTPLAALGLTRTFDLEVRRATSSAVATVIGNAWLAAAMRPPVKRAITFRSRVNLVAGGSVHPALLKAYDRILLPFEQNPQGGRGVIVSVTSATYNHEEQSVEVEADARFDVFDEALARYEGMVRWR